MVIVGASNESVTVHFLADQPVVEVDDDGPSHAGNRYRVVASVALTPSSASRLAEQLRGALSHMEDTE